MQMNLGPTFQVPFSFETRENCVGVTKWYIKRSMEGEYYMLMGQSEGLSRADIEHIWFQSVREFKPKLCRRVMSGAKSAFVVSKGGWRCEK